MSTDVIDIASFWAERRKRYPRPEDLLKHDPWPIELQHLKGKDRLGHLPVYYDFDWEAVIGHNRKTFPNGASLAYLAKQECPVGKYPVLLLTQREDVEEAPIITDTHFVVVVQIHAYLRNAGPDAATSYFARLTRTGVTSIAALKEAASTPEGLDLLLSLVNVEKLKDWAASNDEALLAIVETAMSTGFSELLKLLTIEDIASILEWSLTNDGHKTLEIVERLREDTLPHLYTLTGVARLQRAIDVWDANRDNSHEEFWQQEFAANSFILGQLFCQPVVIIEEKAYVGGKKLNDRGGNLLDFLLGTKLTNNCILVEIKTPTTKLTSKPYRKDVFNVSEELTGAVLQVTNYRHRLAENSFSLLEPGQHIFEPPCVVIIGDSAELSDDLRLKAFEHFRRGQKHVEIVTFDEVYEKIRGLHKLMLGESEAALSSPIACQPSDGGKDEVPTQTAS